MPNLSSSSYQAPFWLRGGHAQTIFPSLFRRIPRPQTTRVRVATHDGDFFHLDILKTTPGPAKGAVIPSLGLEGDSRRGYMRGMALAFMEQGWDAVCRNFRCCGGEVNATRGMYHSGQTDDLHAAVLHCLFAGYGKILLAGFNMGGQPGAQVPGGRSGRSSPGGAWSGRFFRALRSGRLRPLPGPARQITYGIFRTLKK